MHVKERCTWPGKNELMLDYHDKEWGVPQRDDQKLFEYIVLDTFQAGLSWSLILKKREGMRRAFDGFDPKIIANYDEKKIEELVNDPDIIRNRSKIVGTVKNAKAFLEIHKEFGSFASYVWRFVNYETKVNVWETDDQIPSRSVESDEMSIDMKKRGFKFVGTTICYAFMQGAGLINDHLVTCFRYNDHGA